MGGHVLRGLDLATLREDLPGVGLEAGHVGTVVFAYDQGETYEVEVAGSGAREDTWIE
jgi:hypothetical protein